MFTRIDHQSKYNRGQINHIHHHRYRRAHRHYYNTSGWGIGALFMGAVIFIPVVLIASILKLTAVAVHFTGTSMVAQGVVGAKMGITAVGVGAGISSTLTFSAALAIAALFVYVAIGMSYLYFSAKDCYRGNQNAFQLLKSQIVNEDGLSFTGVLKSIGALLWSPFLLIGGGVGMGAKAVVAAYHARFTQPLAEDEVIELAIPNTSYTQMSELGWQNTPTMDLHPEPLHKDSLFYEPSIAEGVGTHVPEVHMPFGCS